MIEQVRQELGTYATEGRELSRIIMPDHGPTHVRSVNELKYFRWYDYYSRLKSPESNEAIVTVRRVQFFGTLISSWPGPYGIASGIERNERALMKEEGETREEQIPLYALGLEPTRDGQWITNKWLEDPTKATATPTPTQG